MGVVRDPDPAMVVVGVIYADLPTMKRVQETLSHVLGPIRSVGKPAPFDWTDYYQKEMGEELWRSFLWTEWLLERSLLADLKLWTNQIEKKHARADGTRQINLDPGLLSAENFVLATTKNYGHRIFLRSGIYAEVTLRTSQGRLEPLEWTYPDYRSEPIRGILEGLRDRYLQLLRHTTPKVLKEVRV